MIAYVMLSKMMFSKMITFDRFVCVLVLLIMASKTTQTLSSFRLKTEPKSPYCLQRGKNITLNCILHYNTLFHSLNLTRPNTNWSLEWYYNGLQWTNATISHEPNKSITSAVTIFTGMYTCVATRITSQSISTNLSVSVQLQPRAVTSLAGTPRFIGKKDEIRYVIISWFKFPYEYEYSLFFKIEQWGSCYPSSCLHIRVKPNCTGMKCTASIDTDGNDIGTILFYIVTHENGCRVKSKVWKYGLILTECFAPPPKTLFYIPYPPTELNINTSHDSVTLKWKDVLFSPPSSVLLTYNCSEHSNQSLIVEQTDTRIVRLTDKDIQGYAPYRKCIFCLAVTEYHCGRYSEPLCTTARLHEEPPSQAPTITCRYDTCPTNYDGRFRNVTVTWKLPPVETWGGVLREVKMVYRDTSANNTWVKIVTNLSSNSAVIKGLNQTQDYAIYLQVCNREGCSALSRELVIFGIKTSSQQLTKANSESLTLWYILVGVVTLVLIVGCVIALRFCIMRPRNSPPDLEKLSEQHDYSDIKPKDEHYDELEQFDELNS